MEEDTIPHAKVVADLRCRWAAPIVRRGFRPMTPHKAAKMAPRIDAYRRGILLLAFRQQIAAEIRAMQMDQLASDGGFEANALGYKDIKA